MKLVVILVVAGVAFWLVGSQLVKRGSETNAVAQATSDNINSVADVLRKATENAQGGGQAGPQQTAWQHEVNAICEGQSAALDRLKRPGSLDTIAAYSARALAIVKRHHSRLALTSPPEALSSRAARAGKALLKQERLLARVRSAALRGDSQAALAAVDHLRALARRANPNLLTLGLAECRLPSWGLPL